MLNRHFTTDESLYAAPGQFSADQRAAPIFLDREYTTYFTLQQALNELLDAGLVKRDDAEQLPL